MQYQAIRKLFIDEVRKAIPGHLKRLSWSRAQVLDNQNEQLQCITSFARQNSAWYQNRLRKLPAKIGLEHLQNIQPTTKAELMANWDDIICRADITKKIAEQHLKKLHSKTIINPYYNDRDVFFATGGSSGLRGLFVWDWESFVINACITHRRQIRDELTCPINAPKRVAVLTAPSIIHASTPLFSICIDPEMTAHHISADQPISKICGQVSELQPSHLIGFSSVIGELAHHADKGKLHISPQRISTNSEPVDDEMRDLVRKVWHLEINNAWGAVDISGVAATEDNDHAGMYLAEDYYIFETVDEDLNPSNNLSRISKLLVTNLYNHSLPVIRYVLDDVMEIIEPPAGQGYRVIKAIHGRTDDWFSYGSIRIHSMLYRHHLGQQTNISEYQVIQTERGAKILVDTIDEVNLEKLQKLIATDLISAGIQNAQVSLTITQDFHRHDETGKMKRFIALQ